MPAIAEQRLFIEDNDFLGPAGSNIQSVIPLIANPGIRVLGFTVVTGDGWCDEEAAYLLRFLEIAKHTEIPVIKGADLPLINTPSRLYAWEKLYGTLPWKGAWNTAAKPDYVPHADKPFFIPQNPSGGPVTKPASGTAADFLIAQVHRYPHQITILAAGPMTNLALAIRLDPAFPSLAKELVFMGGMLDNNIPQLTDNANFYTDFNFIFDPEAAHIVLTADWPKMIGIGNVSSDILFTRAIVDRIASTPSALTRYLATYYAPLPMWDEITAAVAVDPTLITKSIDAYVDVDLSAGVDYGHAHLWSAGHAPRAMGVRAVTLVQEIDRPRFIDQFVGDALALP